MNSVLSSIIDNSGVKIPKRLIGKIVVEYLEHPDTIKELRNKYFGQGYRRGFMDRSEKEYEFEMVQRYNDFFGNPKQGKMSDYIEDLKIDLDEIEQCENELREMKLS